MKLGYQKRTQNKKVNLIKSWNTKSSKGQGGILFEIICKIWLIAGS